jgi:hypothetical protein
MFRRDEETEERAHSILGWSAEEIRRTRIIDIKNILSHIPTPDEPTAVASEPSESRVSAGTNMENEEICIPSPNKISTAPLDATGSLKEILDTEPIVTATCDVYVRLIRNLNHFFFVSFQAVMVSDFQRARSFLYSEEELEEALSIREQQIHQMTRALDHCRAFYDHMNESVHTRRTKQNTLPTTSLKTTELVSSFQGMLSEHLDHLRQMLRWASR